MSENYIKKQLKSIGLDLLEEANNISSIADTIYEGWKCQQAMKYLIELEELEKRITRISSYIDDAIYKHS